MSTKTQIHSDHAPAPVAAYSQGVRKGPIVQISGQVAVNPDTGQVVHLGDVAGQTTQALKNIHAAIRAGGATFDDVVML